MAATYRPPSRARRVAIWLAGFVLTGRVFHGVSSRDLRQVTLTEMAVHAGSMCVVLAVFAYVWVVVPDSVVARLLSFGLLVALVLGGLPILTQWVVTKGMEFRQ